MESWRDQALVLMARPHGEGGAVVTLFTETHGRFAGYVHGGQSSTRRNMLQPGTLVEAEWNARTHEQLGHFRLEMLQQFPALIFDSREKLAALKAACALCAEGLPEREAHTDLFQTTVALLTVLAHTDRTISEWGEIYIKWEIAFLRELGFPLDFTRCAGGGNTQNLTYMSPKSGCAVSEAAGEPYKEKLLPLPLFLRPQGGPCTEKEFRTALNLTLTFLDKWAFAHHTQGVPDTRMVLQEIFTEPAVNLH